MKRYLSVALCILLLGTLLLGCGGSRDTAENLGYAADGFVNTDTEISGVEKPLTSDSKLDSTVNSNRKLIRIVTISAETETYSELLTALDETITSLGGYVESRELYNGNRRSCTMSIRIPADKLDQFVDHVNANSNVTSSTETATDVTLEYVDTEAKITALKTEQARLLELLAGAESLEDILSIEARLSDVTYELERYASRLRTLENQVSYATVNLTIREVEVLTPMEEPTVWYRIRTGFADTVEELWDNLTDLFVWVIVESPNIALCALLIALVFAVATRLEKKRKSKNKPSGPPEQPQ